MNESASEGLSDDIVGTFEYELPVRRRKEFLPWHRPRKHFVRHAQWCEQVRRLLDDIELDDKTLRYLGLPGVDLLDLRHLHDVICQPREMMLRFLGFNRAAQPKDDDQTELNISLDEVRRLQFVDGQSEVIGDDFARIANDHSIAWRRALALGPYHIINLDLCDGFALAEPGKFADTHYNALNKLMSLQSRTKTPWLLLLTTRVGAAHVHVEVMKALRERYKKNLENDGFREASKQIIAVEDEDSLDKVAATDAGLLSLFLCGLSKWLVALGLQLQPPTVTELRSVLGYRVEHGAAHEDLISLALRFTPRFDPAPDPLQLASAPVASPDEHELSVKALRRIAARKDVDGILAGDADLNAEMVSQMTALLQTARYDADEYQKWLATPP
jgi:hypothetical protein